MVSSHTFWSLSALQIFPRGAFRKGTQPAARTPPKDILRACFPGTRQGRSRYGMCRGPSSLSPGAHGRKPAPSGYRRRMRSRRRIMRRGRRTQKERARTRNPRRMLRSLRVLYHSMYISVNLPPALVPLYSLSIIVIPDKNRLFFLRR